MNQRAATRLPSFCVGLAHEIYAPGNSFATIPSQFEKYDLRCPPTVDFQCALLTNSQTSSEIENLPRNPIVRDQELDIPIRL